MSSQRLITRLLSFTFVLLFAASSYAQNQTVVITGNTSAGENLPGWFFNRDTTSPTAFISNTPSIGVGSLYVGPISSIPAHKFQGENFINTPLANIDSISYDFKIGSGGSASSANQFYLNVYVNFAVSDPLKFYDCRYNLVPTTGMTAGYTTMIFDPTVAHNVTMRGGASASPFLCPAIPADMGAGAHVRAFAINVGDTTAVDIGLDGYYDKVVVSTPGGATTYDFEPALTPTNKDQCKKGGWMVFNTPAFPNQGQCVSFVQSNSP